MVEVTILLIVLLVYRKFRSKDPVTDFEFYFFLMAISVILAEILLTYNI